MIKMAGLKPEISAREGMAVIFFDIAGTSGKIHDFSVQFNCTVQGMKQMYDRMVTLHERDE